LRGGNCGAAIAGLQEHGGVRGERQFPPKSDLFYLNKVNKTKNE